MMMTSLQSAIGNQKSAIEAAPPLPGWINTFYRHHKGKKLGPYYVRRWKAGGKIHRQYIRATDIAKARAACDAHRVRKKRQSAFAHEYKRLEGNLNYLARMCKRLRKRSLRDEDYRFANEIEQHGYAIPGRPLLRTKRAFMVPFHTKCVSPISIQAMQSEILAFARKKMNKVLLKMETDEEKLARWKEERDSVPAPSAWFRDFEAMSRQEIEDAIERFLSGHIQHK